MTSPDAVSVHEQGAAQYDKQVHEYNSYTHDVLFGMSYEYVKPGECLLDLGIGTGLASRSFARLGLKVYGCDGSAEMIKVCDSKGFAEELSVLDLNDIPLPFSDNFFDHVICCGVLHFFGDLEAILKEVLRMTKPGGIFAFTLASQTPTEETDDHDSRRGYLETPTPWGVTVFKHSSRYISSLLEDHGADILKTQKLLIRGGPGDDSEDMLFSAFISCRKRTAGDL